MKNFECIYNCGLLKYVDRADQIDLVEGLEIVERKYKKGENVFHEGDIIDKVCLISKGSIRSERTYPNGEVHILTIYEQDSIFALEIALSSKKTTPVDYIANESCTVLFFSINNLEKKNYRKAIRNALIEIVCNENIRMNNKIEILAERGLRNRIIVYLNILASRMNSNVVTVRMSREQLAQYLCVNRSALSNELSKMKAEGLIDFKKYEFTLLSCYRDPNR